MVAASFVDIVSAQATVSVGAKMLAQRDFDFLKGKRVGVVTNQTAVVEGRHLVDVLKEGGVQVGALFAPEHGVRGTAEDGENISSGIDAATGAVVHSLYGATKKPTPDMLVGIDMLLFDIQDIGARFYTYISTMGLAMQAAAQAGIPFVVLDRPNPLGGTYVSGFILNPENRSFTGMYAIPVAHGLTVGELAMMIKGEKMMSGVENLDLRVVVMDGWQRSMRWPETGLSWLPTSPNIRHYEAALLYPGLGLFEGTAISEGRGTEEPFRLVGATGLDAEKAVARLKTAALPGVDFESCLFTPRSLPGVSSRPKFRDVSIPGIRVRITDHSKVLPVETGVHVLLEVLNAMSGKNGQDVLKKSGLRQLAGSARLAESVDKAGAEEIISLWRQDVVGFEDQRKKYLLYK